MATIADIQRLADELEALTVEESLRDIDCARAEWSPAGLRELARLRGELAAQRGCSVTEHIAPVAKAIYRASGKEWRGYIPRSVEPRYQRMAAAAIAAVADLLKAGAR